MYKEQLDQREKSPLGYHYFNFTPFGVGGLLSRKQEETIKRDEHHTQ